METNIQYYQVGYKMNKRIIIYFGGIISGIYLCIYKIYKIKKNIYDIKCERDKYWEMFLMMSAWMRNRQRGKLISDFLERKGFHEIDIYGLGDIGKNLYEELSYKNINVRYLIDRNKNIQIQGKTVKSLGDIDKSVDAVIITVIYNFEEIKEELAQKYNCPILSLADIIYKM